MPGFLHIALQARVGINGTTFSSSPPSMFDINNCNDDSDYMVRAKICVTGCNSLQVPPVVPVYVIEDAIPYVPVYFKYNTLCMEIDPQAWNDRIPINYDMGDVIDDLGTLYSDCEHCCVGGGGGLSCPSEWEDDGQGGEMANFYIEYQTYTVRDRIVVIANFSSADDCPLPEDVVQELCVEKVQVWRLFVARDGEVNVF